MVDCTKITFHSNNFEVLVLNEFSDHCGIDINIKRKEVKIVESGK